MKKGLGFLQIMSALLGLAVFVRPAPCSAAEHSPTSCSEWMRQLLPTHSESKPKRLVDALTLPHHLSLSPEIAAEIRNHPGLRKLSEETYGGQELKFGFPGLTPAHNLKRPLKGEGIQSLMINRILQVAFPLAVLSPVHLDSRPKPVPVAGEISISVWDDAESGGEVDLTDFSGLQMLVLKNGNPLPSLLDRQMIRDLFRFNAADRTLHYYFDDQRVGGDEADKQRVLNLKKWVEIGRVQYVFFTPNFSGALSAHLEALRREFGDVKLLSQLAPGGFKDVQPKPASAIVIINDLAGYKSILDAASTVSIVEGPINHAEALETGTPVISVINDKNMERYNREAFEAALAGLAGTGGLYRVKSRDEAAVRLKELLDQPPKKITPPHQMKVGSAQTTLFHQVLDHLAAYLRHQLKSRNAVH